MTIKIINISIRYMERYIKDKKKMNPNINGKKQAINYKFYS